MKNMLIVNEGNESLRKELLLFSTEADNISIASAFFTETKMIHQWVKEQKKIELIVSLRPPTNYFSLKEILTKIEVSYLGDEFHSKIYIFKKGNEILNAVIGSSNFTSGGLENNIETNVLIKETDTLDALEKHFLDLKSKSNQLDIIVLEKYKKRFEVFLELESKKKRKEDALESINKPLLFTLEIQDGGTFHREINTDFFKPEFLAERWLSEEQIKYCIDEFIKAQERFFLTGELAYLLPLTKKEFALKIGVDKGAITRIFAGNYIQTPFGKFDVDFDELFTEGNIKYKGKVISCHKIYKEIIKIIDEEDKSKPLSGTKITTILNEMGFEIARRTVDKYRGERLGIGNQNERKIG